MSGQIMREQHLDILPEVTRHDVLQFLVRRGRGAYPQDPFHASPTLQPSLYTNP
jgi:hypothetical protein